MSPEDIKQILQMQWLPIVKNGLLWGDGWGGGAVEASPRLCIASSLFLSACAIFVSPFCICFVLFVLVLSCFFKNRVDRPHSDGMPLQSFAGDRNLGIPGGRNQQLL